MRRPAALRPAGSSGFVAELVAGAVDGPGDQIVAGSGSRCVPCHNGNENR